jgi:hypothetical protein
MKTTIVFSLSSTYRPRSVVASLALDQKALGHEVEVVDITDFSHIIQDLPPTWFAKLCGETVHSRNLCAFLTENEIGYSMLTRGANSPELPPGVANELEDAVRSELVTYLRDDQPPGLNRATSRLESDISRAAFSLFRKFSEYLKENRSDRILIPNGRVAHQRLALLAALDAGIQAEYYETGRATPNSYYLGSHQVHDRIGTQRIVKAVTKNLSDEDCRKEAMQWLEKRQATDSSINPFSRGWNASPTGNDQESVKPTAVFFTSSVDEFASYGAEWQNHMWKNQFEAFQTILAKLQQGSFNCVLRVHPNLVNKSRQYVRREKLEISALKSKFPHLKVLWHTSSDNSYDLIKKADLIFVGRSTLGLEASCLGKSVWVTTSARYDDSADVKRLLSPDDVDSDSLVPWQAKPQGAHRFIASWVLQDHPLSVQESQWSSWDSARAPFAIRVGNLLVRNSLRHKLHLIMLEVTRLTNQWDGKRLEFLEGLGQSPLGK